MPVCLLLSSCLLRCDLKVLNHSISDWWLVSFLVIPFPSDSTWCESVFFNTNFMYDILICSYETKHLLLVDLLSWFVSKSKPNQVVQFGIVHVSCWAPDPPRSPLRRTASLPALALRISGLVWKEKCWRWFRLAWSCSMQMASLLNLQWVRSQSTRSMPWRKTS